MRTVCLTIVLLLGLGACGSRAPVNIGAGGQDGEQWVCTPDGDAWDCAEGAEPPPAESDGE